MSKAAWAIAMFNADGQRRCGIGSGAGAGARVSSRMPAGSRWAISPLPSLSRGTPGWRVVGGGWKAGFKQGQWSMLVGLTSPHAGG
jgi:hypothetical protein